MDAKLVGSVIGVLIQRSKKIGCAVMVDTLIGGASNMIVLAIMILVLMAAWLIVAYTLIDERHEVEK